MEVPLPSPEPVVSHAAPVHAHPVAPPPTLTSGGFPTVAVSSGLSSVNVHTVNGGGVQVQVQGASGCDAVSGAPVGTPVVAPVGTPVGAPGHEPPDDGATLDAAFRSVAEVATASVGVGAGTNSGGVNSPNVSVGVGVGVVVGTGNLGTGHGHQHAHQHQVSGVVGVSPHGVVSGAPHGVVTTAGPGVGVQQGVTAQLAPPMQVGGGNGTGELGQEHGSDIVHEYLQEVRRGAPHDARRYHEACEIAFSRKNGNLAQALDSLELARLSNAQCKVMLSVMNVTGCKNSCLAAKKHILACKMVQRQVALQALFDITSRQNLVQAHEQRADGGTPDSEVARVKSLPKTSASADPVRPGQVLTEYVNWARGDVPMFVDGEVLVGQPEIDGSVGAVMPLEALDGDTKPHPHAQLQHAHHPHAQALKRRAVPTTSGALGNEQPTRRRRLSNGDASASPSQDTDIYVKEAEATSASARAVSDTLKAIKEAEVMINERNNNDPEGGRQFYQSVVVSLREKIRIVLGMPQSPR